MRDTRLGRGRMGVILVIVLIASLLSPMAAFAAPTPMGPESERGNTDWAQVYTVKRGDTLSEIAWDFGVSEDALLQANSLRNANHIYVGQQLIIPERNSYGKGGPQCADYYTVRRGDTLSEIAYYKGLDAYALARANGVSNLNDIYVGQTLCIPAKSGGSYVPQQPKWEPEEPKNQGCNPCGQPQQYDGPKNDGPKNEGPKNDGPQRPAGEPQRPNNDGCSPCGQPQNDGPQRPSEPQRPNTPHPNEPQCNNNCGGPQHPDNEHRPESLRPTEYWTGTYYNDKYFGEFALQRQDLEVNFNWSTGSPFGDVNQDRFSVHWEKVEYFKGGPYTFYAVADDGVRVYVDDQLIIDAWVIQPATEYKVDLNLSEGPHKIVVDYYEEAEDARVHVYWEQRRHKK